MAGEFEAVVAAWLRQRLAAEVSSVTSVIARDDDWVGDTDGGFHSEMRCVVAYIGAGGVERRYDLDGDDLGSLWSHVAASWPP